MKRYRITNGSPASITVPGFGTLRPGGSVLVDEVLPNGELATSLAAPLEGVQVALDLTEHNAANLLKAGRSQGILRSPSGPAHPMD